MLKHMKCFVWAFFLLVVLPVGLAAQEFVYTNNDLNGANTVSGFSVASDGTLGEITAYGSPFATGGAGSGGGLYSANRIIVVGNFLYASNSAYDASTNSNSVSAFTIDPATGKLTLIAPPYPTQGYSISNYFGVSLAATPDSKFLYAGTTNGSITIFSINSSTGALSTVGSEATDGPMYSMKVSPNGKFLILPVYSPATSSTNPYGLDVFAIQSDGTLQPAPGSPLMFSSSRVTGVDINCASTELYTGSSVSYIYAFDIPSNGALSPLANSPFSTSTLNVVSNQVVALSTDDNTLYSSNQGGNTVTAFPVGSDGSLDVSHATSAYVYDTTVGTTTTTPGGLAVSKDGLFLYAADAALSGGSRAVSAFGLSGSSPLSFDSATPTGQYLGLRSLAAYPAKSCASSSTSSGLSASLQITAGPPPGFDLEATLALDSSLVVDPLTQSVTIQVGSYTINLPVGSFKSFQSGTNSSIYLYQGVINSTTLKVQITPLGQNQVQFSVYDKQIDLTGLANPVTVTVGIGGNSSSTSASANFGTFTATPFHR